jgi:HK97 family phage major capsid protein
MTEAEEANVRGIVARIGPLDDRIRELSEVEARRLAHIDQARRVDGLARGLHPAVSRPDGPTVDLRSWGQQFVDSGAIAEYARAGGKGVGRAVEVSGGIFHERQAHLVTTADVEGFTQPMVVPSLPQPDEPPTVLSIIRRGTTSSSVIQFPMDEGFTNNARRVAEGQPKPESAINLVTKTAVVGTYAHWVAITRQALEDAPMLRAYVDGRLRDGLLDRIEDLVLNGDSGAGIPGLLTGATAVGGTDLFAVVLAGVAALQAEGYRATAAIANGANFYSLVAALRTSGGAFNTALVTDSFPYRIFGVPLIVDPNMPAGRVLVGDFARGAQLWDRHQTQVLIADQHGELFIRNVLLVLAEWRGTVTVYAPKAFAIGTIAGGAGGPGAEQASEPPRRRSA